MTPTTKDDNVMRSFDTGATRDTAEGKLDMEGFTHPMVEKQFAKYMNMNRLQSDGRLRDSDNWQKGIPRDAYMKSLRRHHDDLWQEHHNFYTEAGKIAALCGIIFNAKGYLLEHLKMMNFMLQDFDGCEPTPEIERRRRKNKMDVDAEGETAPVQPLQIIHRPAVDCSTQSCAECQDKFDGCMPQNENEVESVQEIVQGPTGLCKGIYELAHCHDCRLETKCLDMIGVKEQAQTDMNEAIKDMGAPVVCSLEDWTEDLVEVPEVPVCFGVCLSGSDCISCRDKEECDTHDCITDTCEFVDECMEEFTAVDEDSTHLDDMMVDVINPGCRHDCTYIGIYHGFWPCCACSRNKMVPMDAVQLSDMYMEGCNS